MESANVLLSTLSKPEADSDAAPERNANAAIARFMIMFILSVSFYVRCGMGSPLLLRKDSENRVQRQTRTRSRFGSAETRLSSWNKDSENRSKKGFERLFICGGGRGVGLRIGREYVFLTCF